MLAPGESPGGGALDAERLKALSTGEMTGFQVASERPPAAQEVPLQGPDGPVSLADLRGQVLLVNLWAEWCAPCREEMPTLDKLHQALGGADFRVVPISLDDTPVDKAQSILEEFGGVHMQTLADREMALMTEFGVTGLPATILIDRKGREIGRVVGPADWNSEAAKALINAAVSTPS